MDQIYTVSETVLKNTSNQAEVNLPPDLLIVILGPTASGKTKLAVQLAQRIQGEIISIDSRQVYRKMDIGTGKDLLEYQGVPHHLINICEPGEKYNVALFEKDFQRAYETICAAKKQPIACGGTGLYLQSALQEQAYIQVPIDLNLRLALQPLTKEQLLHKLSQYAIPETFHVDYSTHKRLIRAIEIMNWLSKNPDTPAQAQRTYPHCIFGINPDLALRRSKISDRLHRRLEEGLVEEVQNLLQEGLTHQSLQYYGLEYKYVSAYLLGEITKERLAEKLETEIHRYAKRQMTYFRKMEKDGIAIHWLKDQQDSNAMLEEILEIAGNDRPIA